MMGWTFLDTLAWVYLTLVLALGLGFSLAWAVCALLVSDYDPYKDDR